MHAGPGHAVVHQEEDEGVIQAAGGFELLHDPPDVLIHPVNHRGIERHLEIQFIPHLFVVGFPLRNVEGGQGPFLVDQSQLHHPLVALTAELVPAHVLEPAAVLFGVFLAGMQGKMRGVVGDVEKKGLVGMLIEAFVHEVEGIVGEDVGGVPFAVGVEMIDRGLGCGQHFLVVKIYLTVRQHREIGIDEVAGTVKTVETAGNGRLLGVRAKVPLACHHGTVPTFAEAFGQGRHMRQDDAAVAGNAPIPGHMSHPRLMLIDPGQQGRPGGAASSGVVELGKP